MEKTQLPISVIENYNETMDESFTLRNLYAHNDKQLRIMYLSHILLGNLPVFCHRAQTRYSGPHPFGNYSRVSMEDRDSLQSNIHKEPRLFSFPCYLYRIYKFNKHIDGYSVEL